MPHDARDTLDRIWLISSDSHIVEPPEIWQERMPASFGDRTPHVELEDDGAWWYVDGRKTMSFLGIQTGDRFVKDADELRTSALFEQVRRGAYDPAAFLAENESDGVWGSVIYPSQGLVLYSIPSGDVVDAATRAYNDWIAEFCAHDPARLKGIAMLNVDDPDAAADELVRCREMGLSGGLITVAPPPWMPFRSPAFDRFWATAQDLDMPIAMHVATDRADPRVGDAAFRLDIKEVPPSVFVNKDYQIRQALADIILSGVFERFPKLKIGSVEHEVAWIPFFLTQMDYTYTDRPPRGDWHRFKDPGTLPSDFFPTNCFVSFQEDPVGLRERDVFGVGTLMWGSDYPHTESTFPRSREILAGILANVPKEDAERIVSRSAAELFGFDVPPIGD
jgi:predicted TIM-barrel fold metal-dependent hydrolase